MKGGRSSSSGEENSLLSKLGWSWWLTFNQWQSRHPPGRTASCQTVSSTMDQRHARDQSGFSGRKTNGFSLSVRPGVDQSAGFRLYNMQQGCCFHCDFHVLYSTQCIKRHANASRLSFAKFTTSSGQPMRRGPTSCPPLPCALHFAKARAQFALEQ